MIEFFLRRPLFAGVMSFIVLIAGLITIPTLPISQYPQISPPTVTITSQYPGATAEMVMRSVTTPLEININGSDGLQYMQSYSSANGTSVITCTFNLGTDPTTDQTNVQHGVDLTLSQLPQAVQSQGVTVEKSSGNITIAVAMLSTSSAVSDIAVSNYADLNVIENLKRVPGVGQVEVLGDRTYGMRIWVDPHKLEANNVSLDTILNVIKQNNADVAPGSIGQPPTTGSQPFQIPISINGRLQSPEEFKQIAVQAQPNGGYLRLGDVAQVELGAQNYITSARYNGQTSVVLAIEGEPTANSLQISQNVRATMARIAETMPTGIGYKVAFDTSDFVRASIKEVVVTLLIAILLVVLVIFIFLQSWHSTLIPAITIPVSLIGTFAAMKMLGFSINTLTLFGLTLATGLVVDDAIVVLENIVRHIVDDKTNPFEATARAMREIGGAVVATSLVLMSVFVPVAFLPGTTGLLFQQFALTMAASIGISLFTAMTLAPVLTYKLVHGAEPTTNRFMLWFNYRLHALTNWYQRLVPKLIRRQRLMIAIFIGGIALLGLMFKITPTGFLPNEDQSLLYVIVTLPIQSSMDQTTAMVKRLEGIMLKMPQVEAATSGIGFGFANNSSNQATIFLQLKPLSERHGVENSALALQYYLYTQFQKIPNLAALPANPPAIPGLGSTGSMAIEIEDINNLGLPALDKVGNATLAQAKRDPILSQVRVPTIFTGSYLVTEFNRSKALAFGVTPSAFFDTINGTTGSTFVNFFDYGTRSYQVVVQAKAKQRTSPQDLSRIYVANSAGSMMPVSQFLDTKMQTNNVAIMRYNEYNSYEIDASPGFGISSGQTLTALQHHVVENLPKGMGYDWTGIARQQVQSGPQTIAVFGMGLLFVFLILVAQYESLSIPFVIMLAVPLALLGAIGAIYIRRLGELLSQIVHSILAGHVVPIPITSSDIYAQIGYVMLIGLAAKNAILIVEFANQLREQGMEPVEAVAQAAATRLRPILMTSIAFILGILPLAFAHGDGAQSRISLGTAVLGGMLVSTVMNLAIVPVLYIVVVEITERKKRKKGPTSPEDLPPPPAPLPEGPAPATTL
ncbi:MAG TPA: efflux RND transporter permease subunit [Candidatus Dormibacteraeota bacterium]|nr:efflux RND transporter permease subunit [Candidatus Dormibacteraeota bacterium]